MLTALVSWLTCLLAFFAAAGAVSLLVVVCVIMHKLPMVDD